MYDIELNKTVIQNHIRYDWWKYVLAIICTVVIWSGVTNYKISKAIPEDERMEVFLVGDYIYNDTTGELSEKIMESVGGLQKLDFINIAVNTLKEQNQQMQGLDLEDDDLPQNTASLDPQMDMAGQQKLMVMIGSRSGDIFIFEEDRYKLYAKQGAFLDISGYVQEIVDTYIDKDDLDHLKIATEEDDKPRLYGIPADDIIAFEETGYDVEGKVLCIMAYSKKPDKAWNVAKWLLKGNK